MQHDSVFFGMTTDDEIVELDPVTKKYPFLTIATHKTSDLSTIYVLLSKNLALLEKYIEQHTNQFAEEASRLNRKRDSDDDHGNDVDNDGDEK